MVADGKAHKAVGRSLEEAIRLPTLRTAEGFESVGSLLDEEYRWNIEECPNVTMSLKISQLLLEVVYDVD